MRLELETNLEIEIADRLRHETELQGVVDMLKSRLIHVTLELHKVHPIV